MMNFCDDASNIKTIIANDLYSGNTDWCSKFPNAVPHQTCKKDGDCMKELVREGSGKLNISYKDVGFSANNKYLDKNFPVPPILHYKGDTYHTGLGNTYDNMCGGTGSDNKTTIQNRVELGNHLYYKYSNQAAASKPIEGFCTSANDVNCNPCIKADQSKCGTDINYRMCEWSANLGQCQPKLSYRIDYTDTDDPNGSYFDASKKLIKVYINMIEMIKRRNILDIINMHNILIVEDMV